MCTGAPLPVPRDAGSLVLLRPGDREEDGGRSGTRTWREMTLRAPSPLWDFRDSVLLAPQEGTGWNRHCLQLGLNLSITTQRWKLGNRECWGRSSPLAMAKNPLWHGTGNAVSQGCSRYRTRTAVTPQGTAPCRTVSPAQPCSLEAHYLQRTALQLSVLLACPGLFSESFGNQGTFSTTTFTVPRDSKHGLSSSLVPGSPGEQLTSSSPTNKVTGPPPAALHPLHWLVGWTWKNHHDAECWAGQGVWAQADLAH